MHKANKTLVFEADLFNS